MPDRHTYANTDEFRDYLAGSNYSSGWTADAFTLRSMLEMSSRLIDDYCGGGMFGPKTQTRAYDIGSGELVQSPQYRRTGYSNNLGLIDSLVAIIPLDGWLISPTTVTSYGDTARSSSETLTEGYGNDFFLMPYNFSPKTMMKLNEDSDKEFNPGQQTLTILGSWGYQDEQSNITTASTISSTTATSIAVTSAAALGPAQTILIDTEQLYITDISSNTLSVERAVNGTTGATHGNASVVYAYKYPPQIFHACRDIARVAYRDRDLGVTQNIGAEGEAITVAQNEIDNILEKLASFRVASTSNGVIF